MSSLNFSLSCIEHEKSFITSRPGRKSNELRREKTGLRGFRTGLTQTDLYSHRKELEA